MNNIANQQRTVSDIANETVKEMTEEERKKFRNLKKDEVKKLITAFIQMLKTIEVNGKPFIVSASTNFITTNPDISIEEMQDSLKIHDESK
jgi:hypothetical protein